MKLSMLKLVLASLAVSSFVLAGCSADSSDPGASGAQGEESEDVGVSADELHSRSQQYIGSYAWRAGDSGAFVDFQQLTLKGNGTYTAKVDSGLVNPAVRCIAFPCTLPESGSWFVVRSGGKDKIRVNPWGPKPTRSYFASVNPLSRTLTLTRFGNTTNLFTEGSSCANVRCTATTHCEMTFASGQFSPSCVPNAPVVTCAQVRCAAGTTCVDSPTGASCEPNPVATCAATLCITGTTCIDKPTGAECVANPPLAACVKTGCSGQICADSQRFSTCEFRPEYACYQAAACERQSNGQCGFTSTPSLTSCLANP